MYQLEGSVKLISAPQSFQSGFTKREFVVTTDDQYPQDIKFECVKDKCALLDAVAQGQRVKVSFQIRGNEYQGRYFVNLQAFKVEGGAAGAASAATSGSAPSEAPEGHGDGGSSDSFADEESPF
ncbi:MAG: hypothetical protein ACI8T1_005512 [Verrucomicrobiales bacterium]|jgi:hypothetical protein